MKKITDIINESNEDIYKEVKKLQDESTELAKKTREIFNKYDDGKNDYSFWNNAPKEVITEYDKIWNQIEEKTTKINTLLKNIKEK